MTATTDPTPVFINTHQVIFAPALVYNSVGTALQTTSAGLIANTALYLPFRLPVDYSCARIYWVNGSAVSGNVDVGVYNANFTQVFHSGSVLQAGTTAPQYVAFSQTLSAGTYYLALAPSSGSAQFVVTQNISATNLRMFGLLEQTSAFPLPDPMAPATPINPNYPLVGLTRTASGY